MKNFISNYGNIPNPITKFFNKIDSISLDGDYSKMIEWLEAMKKVPLYAKRIEISSNSEEQLEHLTAPNLHNTPIDNLQLELKSFNVSAKTIENLKSIYPNSIKLINFSETKDKIVKQGLFENFTKLLSKLDQTTLEMGFKYDNFSIKLEFSDVIFKVVELKNECSYIRAKSVMTNCAADDFCWIK